MRIDVVSIFPEVFPGPLGVGIMGRARERGLVDLVVWDLRDFSSDQHRTVDDIPYGGGAGMVMKAEPFIAAVAAIRAADPAAAGPVILTTPQGKPFSQAGARALARLPHLIVLCGRYEGVDERVLRWVDEEISLGDFVLTGGEVAALALIEAMARLVPGVLGNALSAHAESFSGGEGLLEGPQYTRPPEFRGLGVPEVLLSGDHEKIARWRKVQAVARTRERRPDLLTRRKA